MSKPLNQYTEDDWMEDYRKKGEHIAIDAVELGKVSGVELLGARKFIVAESNRRHMEPIRAAAKSRAIAVVAILVSVASLVLNFWNPFATDRATKVELQPTPKPLRVYLSNGSAPESVQSPKSQGAEPRKPASE